MPGRTRVLAIRLNTRLVGHLVNSQGFSAFFAEPEHVADPRRPVLSQSFRGSTEEATRELLATVPSPLTVSRVRVPPFFANLLPEGAARARLAAELRVAEDAEFDMLAATGRDLAGAVTATLTDEVPTRALAYFGEDIADNVSHHIGKATTKFSLSGVQLKFSVLLDLQGHYVLAGESEVGDILAKPPHPAYPHLPENEYASMRLARLAGVDTPEFWLADSSEFSVPGFENYGGAVYAIRRFDRAGGERIHIEDFGQVLNLRPAHKYGHTNYNTILRVIANRTRNGLVDARQFVRRLVVNILLGNADAHIKNFSLIYRDPREPDLAPAYDIVSTIQYLPDDPTKALGISGEKLVGNITVDTFDRLEKKVGLPRPTRLADEARRTVQQAQASWPSAISDLPVDDRYKDAILTRLRTLPIVCP